MDLRKWKKYYTKEAKVDYINRLRWKERLTYGLLSKKFGTIILTEFEVSGKINSMVSNH